MGKGIQVCTVCGRERPLTISGKCSCGGTLLVRYDLERICREVNRDAIAARPATMWRYHELLPVEDLANIVSMGEGWTPLLRMPVLEIEYGLSHVWIKREEQNPTGSFKARGFSAAVSLFREHGIKKAAVNSNGNAAAALAAYAARAGIEAHVILPKDCPIYIVRECEHYGAFTYVVDGLIHDAGRIVEERQEKVGWTSAGTMKEPGRTEGKKTMGLEIAEQLGWALPDTIIYPTGGGSGIIGLWKAFKELIELGWVKGPMPRLVSVQESGCDPLAEAIRNGGAVQPKDPDANVMPTGLRVPYPPDGNLLVSILKETGGTAVAVERKEIREVQGRLGLLGVSASPEGAATLAGLIRLREKGWLNRKERVILFNTSHAMKYISWGNEGNEGPVRVNLDAQWKNAADADYEI
jgi:threonine synthase